MLKKRKWCYAHAPGSYDITCDICGGSNIMWSEYEHMIWCYTCEKDTRGTEGIFDGPIPDEICKLIGLTFDRIDIKTGKRLYQKTKNGKMVWEAMNEQEKKKLFSDIENILNQGESVEFSDTIIQASEIVDYIEKNYYRKPPFIGRD